MDVFIRNFISKHLRIIKKHSTESLIKLLSALEYTEAILEITADKLFGNNFKWFIIFLTHLVKCVIKLQLLIVHKFGIQTLPALFTLQNFLGGTTKTTTDESIQLTTRQQALKQSTFTLKHSGRVIRSIKNSPVNLETRDWVVPNNDVDGSTRQRIENSEEHFDATQDKQRYLAEVLHIMRPICHLSAMIVFKSNSWKQFLIPLFIDTLSLILINGTKDLSQSQKSEVRRRSILMLYYLIRSPFYEKYSNQVITLVLSQVEQRINGSKYLIGPLTSYIPQWRSMYNYCWTS